MTPDRDDQIRTRAYHLWEAAGRPDCSGTRFWDQATAEFATPPLNGLLGYVQTAANGDPPPCLNPNWDLKLSNHEGDHLPPVRGFAGAKRTSSGGVHYGAFTPHVRRDLSHLPETISSAARNATAPAVPSCTQYTLHTDTTDESPPMGVFLSPPEVAGRLARVAAACKADEEKLTRVLQQKRNALAAARRDALGVVQPPVPEDWAAMIARYAEYETLFGSLPREPRRHSWLTSAFWKRTLARVVPAGLRRRLSSR